MALTDAVRFVDPVSQRTLAIRPDMTAQVARIAATRMGDHRIRKEASTVQIPVTTTPSDNKRCDTHGWR